MEIPLLLDLLIIFGLAIAVLVICHRLHVAGTVGFLLTGILAGPNGFGLITAVHEVEVLAEIGVVLLLFTIGIEFSMAEFIRIKRSVLLGGSLQVLMTTLAASLVFQQLGLTVPQSVFAGFLISLSSTAIVLKILQEKAQIESPYGQTALAVLIFQDVAVVPMMLVTPMLAGAGGGAQGSALLLIGKGVGILLLVLFAAKWVVPRILYQIARTRSRELFLLSVLTIGFGVAFLTYNLGLSLALGAFLAGLIISETEFSHETLGSIVPFRDVFTSLFFVSIGMLLDAGFLIRHPAQILSLTLGVMAAKAALASLSAFLLGFPIRVGVLVGLTLCQVGEFSFILFTEGKEFGLLGGEYYQLFLNVSVLTMGVTPFIISSAPRLADAIMKLPLPTLLKTGYSRDLATDRKNREEKLRNHLIIVGYGFNGRNLALTARATAIPYIILEMNPETVRRERRKGEPIWYGDATSEEVLESAWVREARVLVVVISDPLATRRIVATVRKLNPNVFIIARTRFVSETSSLHELGTNEVIPEEFETSVEIFSRVLAKYLVPKDEIEKLIARVRAGGYGMFRTASDRLSPFSDLAVQIPDLDIGSFRVQEGSTLTGRSLADTRLRSAYGVTLLAIRRGDRVLANPDSYTVFQPCDIAMLLGRPDDLAGIRPLFMGEGEGEEACLIPNRAQTPDAD